MASVAARWGLECGSIRRTACLDSRADVGLPKLLAAEQQRIACHRRRRIGQTVSEVQRGGMAAAAVAIGRVQSAVPFGLTEWDDRDAELADQAVQFAPDRPGAAPRQN